MLRFENDDGRSLLCRSDLMVKWVHREKGLVWLHITCQWCHTNHRNQNDDQKSISAKIVSN